MKNKSFFLFAGAILYASLLVACLNDSDEPVDPFNAAVVCPAEGVNAHGEPNRGTFTDARDGQVYKYTTIGNQVWMAENLKFDAPYSLCYEEIEGFCDTFGRFYSLHVNGEHFENFDQELLYTICPAGWHIPSVDEWIVLFNNMGGEEKAAHRLMSSSDFGERYKPGTDDCSFNSLPAGQWAGRELSGQYGVSRYWTSTARDFQSSFNCSMTARGFDFNMDYPKMSIRCIKD